MNQLDYQELQKEFTIIEEMTGRDDPQAGHVYQAYLNVSRPLYVVLKEIDQKRAQIYQKLCGKCHPNLAAVYEVRKLPHAGEGEPGYLCITEFVYGQSLAEIVTDYGPLSIEETLEYTSQIAEGISFMHRQNFVHKDIKPDNIMVSKDRKTGKPCLKIIDLGISETWQQNKSYATEIGGTIGYRAPEVNDYVATFQSDIFSLGCVMNFMLCGEVPSTRKYRGNIAMEKIIHKAANLEASGRYSSIEAMRKAISHECRQRLWDKLPVLRSIPGYRSHTGYRMLAASCYYAYMLYYLLFQCYVQAFDRAAILACFYVLIPWLTVFDTADLMYRLRKGRTISLTLTWWINLGIILGCILIPILLGYGIPVLSMPLAGGLRNG